MKKIFIVIMVLYTQLRCSSHLDEKIVWLKFNDGGVIGLDSQDKHVIESSPLLQRCRKKANVTPEDNPNAQVIPVDTGNHTVTSKEVASIVIPYLHRQGSGQSLIDDSIKTKRAQELIKLFTQS